MMAQLRRLVGFLFQKIRNATTKNLNQIPYQFRLRNEENSKVKQLGNDEE